MLSEPSAEVCSCDTEGVFASLAFSGASSILFRAAGDHSASAADGQSGPALRGELYALCLRSEESVPNEALNDSRRPRAEIFRRWDHPPFS